MSTQESKARSRISAVNKIETAPSPPASSRLSRADRRNRATFNFGPFFQNFLSIEKLLPRTQKFKVSNKYIEAFPFLALGLTMFGLLSYIFYTVRPGQVANWLLYHSFLPILIIFFLGTYFLSRFALLHKVRALGPSLWLTILLFLKFQDFALTLPLVLITGATCLGATLIWSVLFRS